MALIFLSIFLSGFYIYYLYKRPQIQYPERLLKHYPRDFILKTGGSLSFPEKRLQHFLRFLPSEKFSLRIGTFGDSHTYGDEVHKTNTYPYQLQELFNQNFADKNIEILNFGVSGHGFQEQFFLLEKYAKAYRLDYILIGPRGLHSSRDVTFRKNWAFHKLIPPKERFILSKNKLKLIQIKGTSLKERYKKYYSLIPSWSALHYDRRPFQIWEHLFPFLWNNISNPLYHKKIPEDRESSQINKILLQKIQTLYDKKIIFLTDYKPIFDSYRSEKILYNLNYIKFKRSNFYKVFYHESSFGNEITAKIYFNALIGKKEFSVNIINCHPESYRENSLLKQSFKNPIKKRIRKFALFDVKSIQINTENRQISSLRRNSSDHYWNKRSASHYIDKKTRSFIALSNKNYFLDSPAYFPVPFQLKEGMGVYVQSGFKEKIKLGSIIAFDEHKKIFHFYGKYIKNTLFTYTHYKPFFYQKDFPLFLKNNLKPIFKLFIEDYKLGSLDHQRSKESSAFKFTPTSGYDASFLMMGPSHYIRNKDLPEKFSLHIQYNLKTGVAVKSSIPNWKCRKEETEVKLNLPNFKNLY